MKQLALNTTKNEEWDLILENGQLLTVSDSEYIPQKAKQILLTFKNEWYQNTTIGIPYFEAIFIKNPQIPNIQAIFRDALKNDTIMKSLGVTNVTIDSISLFPITRSLSVALTIFTGNETIQMGFAV